MKELPISAPLPGMKNAQSLDEWSIALRLIDESEKRCSAIDKRISQLISQFETLSNEYELLKESGSCSSSRLSQLVEQMDINRDLRIMLHELRWKNT